MHHRRLPVRCSIQHHPTLFISSPLSSSSSWDRGSLTPIRTLWLSYSFCPLSNTTEMTLEQYTTHHFATSHCNRRGGAKQAQQGRRACGRVDSILSIDQSHYMGSLLFTCLHCRNTTHLQRVSNCLMVPSSLTDQKLLGFIGSTSTSYASTNSL